MSAACSIVSTFHGDDDHRRLQHALALQQHPPLEHIVVHALDALLPQASGNVRHIHAATALGDGACWNAGARAARGDVVVFVAQGARPDPTCLAALVAAFDGHAPDVVTLPARGGDPARERAEAEVRALQARDVHSDVAALGLAARAFAIAKRTWVALDGFAELLDGLAGPEFGLRVLDIGGRIAFLHDGCVDDEGMARVAPLSSSSALGLLALHPRGAVLGLATWLAATGTTEPGAWPALEAHLTADSAALSSLYATAFGQRCPLAVRFSLDALATYFVERAAEPPCVTWLDVRAALRDACAHGPAHDDTLDRFHADNHMQTATPYFEAQMGRCLGRHRPTPRLAGDDDAPLARVEVRGTARVHVSAAARALVGDDACLTVPVPVPCAAQSDVVLDAWEPAGLAAHLDAARGLLWKVPLSLCGNDDATFAYSFSCIVHEQGAAPGPAPGDDNLRVTLPARSLPRARAVLAAVAHEAGDVVTARDKALAIYRWLLDRTRMRFWDRPAHLTLETGVGSCVQRARTYAELCRLWGVATRERCGAIGGGLQATPPTRAWTGPVMTSDSQRSYTLFGHVWVEIHDDRLGWLPVDLLGADYGARSLTPHNAPTAAFRDDVIASTARLDGYYFGHVDPLRIHASPEAARVVTHPIGTRALSADALHQIAWETRHTLQCTLDVLR